MKFIEEPIPEGKIHVWIEVDENDTPLTTFVDGGDYTVNVEGTFGGASIEIKYGDTDGTEATIDAANLTFTEDGSYNMRMSRGYVLPVLTGGTGTAVKIKLTPIPRC